MSRYTIYILDSERKVALCVYYIFYESMFLEWIYYCWLHTVYTYVIQWIDIKKRTYNVSDRARGYFIYVHAYIVIYIWQRYFICARTWLSVKWNGIYQNVIWNLPDDILYWMKYAFHCIYPLSVKAQPNIIKTNRPATRSQKKKAIHAFRW